MSSSFPNVVVFQEEEGEKSAPTLHFVTKILSEFWVFQRKQSNVAIDSTSVISLVNSARGATFSFDPALQEWSRILVCGDVAENETSQIPVDDLERGML
jgi:hypothetical protein